MDLSFALLKTFLAVADTESFTVAGRQVHLTQSAVSMQIKRLTEIVGRPLFDIQGKTISTGPLKGIPCWSTALRNKLKPRSVFYAPGR